MPDLDYCKIVGRIAITAGDANDADDNPEVIWANQGSVTFTPLVPAVKVVGDATVGPFTAVNTPITANIGSDGRLTYQNKPYVMLIDLGSTKVNPRVPSTSAAYRVSFNNVFAQGLRVTLPDFDFHPLPGQDNDITLLTPLTTAGGQAIVQGPTGVGVKAMVVSNGHLMVTLTDNTQLDAGLVPTGSGTFSGTADNIADGANKVIMTAVERTRLAGMATNATANDTDANLRDRSTHTGTDSLDSTTDSATRLAMTPAERTKLQGVAPNATANATDAALRDRATHTGTQSYLTVAGLQEFIEDTVSNLVVSSAQVTWTYDDALGQLALSVAGTGGTPFDAESARDTIGSALVGVGGVVVTPNDAGDTIVITVSNVPISSIAGLQAALDLKLNANSNLADLPDKVAARTNLGLATGAVTATGTAQGQIPVLQTGGLLALARLGTGTPSGSTALFGDGTWKQPPTDPDMVRSAAGKGGYTLLIEGVDTPTGDPKEIVLSSTAPSSGGSSTPPGFDVDNGYVACTISDPALTSYPRYDSTALTDPTKTDAEAGGNVLIVAANTRIAARFRIVSGTRIDRLSWMIGDGSTASVTGTIQIARASDGVVLASSSTVALTPAAVTAVYGNSMNWNLASPITGLTPGDELVVLFHHTSGTVRYYARGVSGLFNQTALRPAGSLNRAGAYSSTTPSASRVDFSGVANAGAGWTKRPVPVVLAFRTS